ncbi:molybdenum cofactor guanylyltransferase [Salarchaeum japonicum]|uniref:MobA-like NTP transferase domain-containing protein n=1 Tax=Salarchaeum japonicum TaxID=555573 RepID=A0AAV3T4M5_9EURY|nr:NTP transferase domain-containing protein [Salarchaeum japonicum]
MPDQRDRGVVLAGGDSTRFGDADKALAAVAGTPMVRRVFDALADATGTPPAVAAGSSPPDAYRRVLPDGVRFVPDDDDYAGPLAGLAAAAAGLDADWLFAAATDLPRLDAPAVRWLAAERTPDCDAVVPVAPDGVQQPLCAWYRRRAVLDALTNVAGTAGPRALLDRLAVRRVTQADAPPAVSLADALTNVNTRDEFGSLDP